MSPWLIALAVGIIVGLVQYGWHELRRGGSVLLTALLRIAAVTLIVALLLDAPVSSGRPVSSWVALDASQSMVRGDSSLWRAARDSLARIRAESSFVFGDSIRRAGRDVEPRDQRSLLRPLVDRAVGSGHPMTVITDGEVDDPEAAGTLPAGSRLIVLKRPPQPDLAVAGIDMPRAVVSGDTVETSVNLIGGGGGSGPGTLLMSLDDVTVASASIDSMRPFAERTISLRTRLDGPAGPALLRVVVKAPHDVEPRNDTLVAAIDLSRAASAVFVSTSPDFDARYALAVLRGALTIPTAGYFRVAPGEWRIDGALTPISQERVRQALRDAPIAIIHGDTAAFGPPLKATRGPLALIVTTPTNGEWYPTDAPASPLAPALAGVIWDSLPPVGVTSTPPAGEWRGVEVRRGRGEESRPMIVGFDEPRREVIVAASGLWRWRFRGGAASDAFTSLWGSIFDWLAAERADRRAVVPDERLLRAGDPVRWRRGSAADSVVTISMRRRGTTRTDSLTLRFLAGTNVVESSPVAAGVYDVVMRGGTAVLAVNASREWIPRNSQLESERVGGTQSEHEAPRLQSTEWAYALAILLLCAEWILRRRRGLR